MGSMQEMYERYREPDAPIAPHRRLSHLHNNVIQVLAERGVIGLCWWLALWGVFFYQAGRAYRGLSPPLRQSVTPLTAQIDQSRALMVGSIASVVGFLVAGVFEHNFGDAEVITMLYFLMALPFVLGASRLSTTGAAVSHKA